MSKCLVLVCDSPDSCDPIARSQLLDWLARSASRLKSHGIALLMATGQCSGLECNNRTPTEQPQSTDGIAAAVCATDDMPTLYALDFGYGRGYLAAVDALAATAGQHSYNSDADGANPNSKRRGGWPAGKPRKPRAGNSPDNPDANGQRSDQPSLPLVNGSADASSTAASTSGTLPSAAADSGSSSSAIANDSTGTSPAIADSPPQASTATPDSPADNAKGNGKRRRY